jgi:hypothetical protein
VRLNRTQLPINVITIMTIAKDFASKFAVAFVAIAMIFMAVAPSARAATQTPEELQKTINDLLAQVASLQSQVGGSKATTPATSCTSFTLTLKKGSTGAEVKALQELLNSDADTMVAATGAGSKGMETMTFGPATAAAVSKFQVKYRAEILTPAGLVNPTGVFGPGSRAQANKLCAGTTPTEPTKPGTTPSTDLSGEADLNDVTVDSADDTSLEEGSDKVDLGSVTVNYKNGDAKIDRLDIKLNRTGGSVPGETHPWKAFDTLYVMVDGKEVASKDVSARADYLDDAQGTVRLSGLDIVAKEDEDVVITIAADLQKGGNASNNWDLSAEGLRYFDASGVATTEDSKNDLRGGDSTGSVAGFTIDEAGTSDELIVKSNSSNPADSTLELKDDAKSDWYPVLVFDLDTKDSTNDITLNDVFVNVAHTSGVTYATLVDDARITIDGKVIDSSISDVTNTASTTGPATIDFNVDGDVVISAGDRVEAKVELRFKSLAGANEGKTVTASVTGTNADQIDAEGSDTLTTSQISGSATGKIMTLRTKGIDATSKSNEAVKTTAAVSGAHDYVTYTMKVDVTAFNQDLYISKTPGTSLVYDKTDSSGTALGSTGSTTVDSFTSTANDTDAPGYYHVAEGDTETFTIVVKWAPGKAWAATGIQLVSLKYAETATSVGLSTWTAAPASDYRTDAVSTNL